ncbi:SDR family oxidoreductase [Microbacterium esteraromaticum]|uniref:SDR family NAD(P)-dependent oxidoreductase n=1 Tax=Microbacterium esteraromaticum TaxID=57043 RepID=UPI001CD2D055|nr:SDR family oxidoreductase [Microbacterium esteraromaticum]MCA1307846.1 SDR family oxidoreductase [Microbacterium esteraromaticum]
MRLRISNQVGKGESGVSGPCEQEAQKWAAIDTAHSALITGAGSGVGAAIAVGLAACGMRVAVTDLDKAKADDVARRIIDAGGTAAAQAIDVSDRSSVSTGFDHMEDSLGSIGYLVNSAGISQRRRLLDITPDDWERLTSVNGLGALLCMQEGARRMIANGITGRIVNITSTAARRPNPGFAHYASTKAMVSSLIQSGARALAPHGITVMGIAPGIVQTPMWEGIEADSEGARIGDYADRILLGRVSTPDDIVGAAVFLASRASDYMTGQVVMVDGGMVLV